LSDEKESSGRRRSFLRAEEANSGEFELNLAPVIDCLTVLIVYTMISASFLSLGVFNTTIPSEGKASASLIPVQVRVDMHRDRSIEMTVSGAEKQSKTFVPKEQDWDFNSMIGVLNELKGRYALLTTVTLAADPQVHYNEVVRGVERSKQSIPNVVLGE
jgi:biopolymer transport protein ExbD